MYRNVYIYIFLAVFASLTSIYNYTIYILLYTRYSELSRDHLLLFERLKLIIITTSRFWKTVARGANIYIIIIRDTLALTLL